MDRRQGHLVLRPLHRKPQTSLRPFGPKSRCCKNALQPRRATQPHLAMELAREHQLMDRLGGVAGEAEEEEDTGYEP